MEIGCASCHRPSWTTGEANYWAPDVIKDKPLPKYPNQKINLGEYRGFPMTLSLSGQTFQVSMKKNLSYTAEIATDPSGNITRINHVLEKMPDRLKTQQERLLTLQSELEQAKEEVKRPFSKEEELLQKAERLIQLNKELDLDE